MAVFFQEKRHIGGDLSRFSQAYDQSKSKFLEEMLVPYCVADITGRIFVDEPGNGSYSWGMTRLPSGILPRCFRILQRKCWLPAAKR